MKVRDAVYFSSLEPQDGPTREQEAQEGGNQAETSSYNFQAPTARSSNKYRIQVKGGSDPPLKSY